MKLNNTARPIWASAMTILLAFLSLPVLGATNPYCSSTTQQFGARSLAAMLNADGTLRTDTRGSFDARGYHFSQTRDGRPQFCPASTQGTGDDKWQDGFGVNGTDGEVKALVYAPTGELYAGGTFTAAGNTPAVRIGKWDGTRWNALGSGIGMRGPYYTGTDAVNAIAVDGAGNVYAGGIFTRAGGVAVSNVAKWDGTRWSAMGSGVAFNVHALAVDAAGNVYAGGQFGQGGGITKWDGTQWSTLGSGLSYRVNALVVDGAGNVYAGGTGVAAGGAYIDKWNGTAWSPLGAGLGSVSGGVRTLATDAAGNVYAGGSFNSAGGIAVNNVAKWNGTSWSALGAGIPGRVYALAFDRAGNFYAAGYDLGNTLLKWNGTAWLVVTGVSSVVNTLAADGAGGVAAGGTFTKAANSWANFVAKWDGIRWNNLATGLNNTVFAVAADGRGNVYVGGQFKAAGGVEANLIAKWDGTRWSALGTGLAGVIVRAIAIDGAGNVYAGGSFSQAGNTPAQNIAKWDGTSWSALRGTTNAIVNGEVFALAVDGAGNVYAGGRFGITGILSGGIAKWDGRNWVGVGTGAFDFPINALLVDDTGNVYAGGSFTRIGGAAFNHVAKWDGTRWHALGAGAPGYVHALALARNGKVYVGGEQSTTTYTSIFLAAWDGTSLSPLIALTGGYVYALAVDGDDNLYVGGGFSALGTFAADFIAKWNGTSWATLGTGLNNEVRALSIKGASPLCVGGFFNAVGDASKATAYVGLYNTGARALPLAAKPSQRSASVQLYPNPAQSHFVVKCSAGRIEQGKLLNSQGQVVRHLSSSDLQAPVAVRGLATGVYTLQLLINEQVLTQRLVIK